MDDSNDKLSLNRPVRQILYTVVIFVAGTVLGVVFQQIIQNGPNPTELLMGLVFLCLAVISIMIFMLMRYVDEMRPRRITVRFYDLQQKNVHEQDLYVAAKNLAVRAEHFIWVATFSSGRGWSANSSAAQARQDYFDTLLSIANNPAISYVRILNIAQDTIPLIGSPEFYEHLRLMAGSDPNKQISNAYLRKTSVGGVGTFMLVDNKHLIWEIDERLPDSQESRLRAFFVFNDPHEQITQYFNKIWEQMFLNSTKVEVHELVPESAQ